MSKGLGIPTAIACLLTTVWVLAARSFSIEQADFPALYTGAAIAKTGRLPDLHNIEVQAQLQSIATEGKRSEVTYFVRPHVYAAILAPLALTDIRTAFWWFIALNAGVLLIVYFWAARALPGDAIILLALFPHVIFGAASGQDCVLFLGVLVLGYHLYEREYMLAAGLIFGLAAIKPHLVFLIPVAMLLQRRFRMLAGFVTTALTEACVSVCLGGVEGIGRYVRFLRDQQQHLSPHPERMLNFNSILLNAGLSSEVLNLFGCVAIVGMFWIVCRRFEWWRAFAGAVAATLLVAPHTISYDAAWMVLPAWLVFFNSQHRLARASSAAFFTPLPWLLQLADQPWTALPAVILLVMMTVMTWDAYSSPALQISP